MYDYGETSTRGKVRGKNSAVDRAKAIIKESISTENHTGECLVEQWMAFGEDVILTPLDDAPEIDFSGEAFVRSLCKCPNCKT